MSAAALAPWAGSIISMGDVGVYATLCSLATLGRAELKTRVVESEGVAGEGEGMKELLEAWMASNFRAVLELLSRFSVSPFPPLSHQNSAKTSPPIRPVFCSIHCSVRTSGPSSRSYAPAPSYSISSRSRRSGWSV